MFSYKIYYFFFVCTFQKEKKRPSCATILPQNSKSSSMMSTASSLSARCAPGYDGAHNWRKKTTPTFTTRRRYFGSTQKKSSSQKDQSVAPVMMAASDEEEDLSSSSSSDDCGVPLQSYWVAEAQTQFIAETNLPTDKGFYRLRGYRHRGPKTHVITEPTCMLCGDVEGLENVPVRVHDACWTSEALGSLKCDCKQQLDLALEYIRDNELGVVIYLQQEGRGIGLANKIAAYKVQESGVDTVDANRKLGLPDDTREYSAVRGILDDLKIKSVALMTNNPRKINELKKEGVNVTSRIPCVTKANLFSEKYLEVKERRMSHVLNDSWRYFDNAGQVFESKDEADAKGDFSDYSMTWDEKDDLGNRPAKGIN